jgi:chloramphenicol 3-O phosphotransferase
MVGLGRVVVLNGVSSAGKSTIIDAFWERRNTAGELWMRIGIDDYIAQLGPALAGIPGHDGAYSSEGFRIVEVAGGGVRCETGPIGRRVFAAYHRTVATWARCGLDVIVDECAYDREEMDDWVDALGGVPSLWIAVHCAPDVVAQRERDRGDRVEGLGASQLPAVHAHRDHAAAIDTTTAPADESLAAIDDAIATFAWSRDP